MKNFYQELMDEFTRRVTPLEEKRTALQNELEGIKPSHEDAERHQAKIAVLERKLEEALVGDETKTVNGLRGEIKEIKEAMENRWSRVQGLNAEIEALNNRIEQVGNGVLADLFPGIQQEVRSKMDEAVQTIETVWDELQQFSRETGVELSMGKHFEGLRFPPVFQTEVLRKRLDRWL